jgi:hypothetical protein
MRMERVYNKIWEAELTKPGTTLSDPDSRTLFQLVHYLSQTLKNHGHMAHSETQVVIEINTIVCGTDIALYVLN